MGESLPSGSFDVRVAQVVVHSLLGNPEGTSDANRRQLTVVHQAINRHLRNAHHGGDFGDGKETNFRQRTVRGVRHKTPILLTITHRPSALTQLLWGVGKTSGPWGCWES